MKNDSSFQLNLGRRMSFKFWAADYILLLWALLIAPVALWLPEEVAYENGPIETVQLLVLAAGIVMCFKAKVDKKFYIFLALLCVILCLREVNCGRTIFFPKDEPNEFYSWKEIPYGYLAHPLFGLFMAGVGVYFLLTKSFKVLWKYMLHAKIAVWTWLFLFLGIVVGTVGEKMESFLVEEMAESLFYFSFVAIIAYHAFCKEHNEPVEEPAETAAKEDKPE